MSAVSNSVMPRSIALWITLREVSRSVRWPKLLQPRPTAETRRPAPPRSRICMDWAYGGETRARVTLKSCGAERVMDRADQRGAGRQHASAIARSALGEQHHGVAAEQPAGDLAGRGAGLVPGLPVDEDRSLQFREPAEHRPSRDLALGDEHH